MKESEQVKMERTVNMDYLIIVIINNIINRIPTMHQTLEIKYKSVFVLSVSMFQSECSKCLCILSLKVV